MDKISRVLLLVWIIIYFKPSTILGQKDFIHWGPSVAFENGDYWGQSALDETSGTQVPHGTGTYISKQGNLLYAGSWWRGYMHGRGNRYFADGRNYSGNMEYNTIHGEGTLTFPNGTIFKGHFNNGVPNGEAEIIYPNGDSRHGHLVDGRFVGLATYKEASTSTDWSEDWYNGSYPTRVYIYKKVLNRYNNSLSVEIICKTHSQNAKAELLREGVHLEAEVTPPAFEGHEIQTIVSKLPFSDDSFKVYACRAVDKMGNILVEDKLQVRNPFFLESYGECGVQFALAKNRRRKKRSSGLSNFEERIIMGREISYPGEVPWQALLSTNLTVKSIVNGKMKNEIVGDFCGGTIISPWHILTAAHCLKIGKLPELALGRDIRPDEVDIKIGHMARPRDPIGQIYKAKRFAIHRDFDSRTFFNDIALISLQEKIRIDAYVNPVCLPKQKLQISYDDFLVASGFGLTFNTSDPYRGWHIPSHLMVTHLRLLTLKDCFPPQNEQAHKFDGHICAGSPQHFGEEEEDDIQADKEFVFADTCRGDSGGPVTLRYRLNGRFYLAGLVSTGARVCGTAHGAVYVNVTHYLSWIHRAKLQDLIEDFKSTNNLPYDKMDSSVFGAIFEYLSKEDNLV